MQDARDAQREFRDRGFEACAVLGDELVIANPGERIVEGAKVATGPTEPGQPAQAEAKPAEKPAPAKVVNAAVSR